MPDLDRYQYGYDQNSNRLWKANVVGTPIVSGGLDEYYTYDNLNRLTEMQRGTLNSGKTGITGTPSREMDYTLDPTGNWSAYLTKTAGTTDLNQTRSHNPVNEITAIASAPGWATPPAYDPAGNMTSFPEPASPSSAYTATYDAWNRMVSVSAGSSTVARYQYDGRGRRVVKVTIAISETRHFYYTNWWRNVEERVGSSTTMDKQYVWGRRYVDELVCRDETTPRRLYACQDANFNLTAIANTSGNVVERYVFDPYGTRLVYDASWTPQSTSGYSWVVGFQGLTYDAESEMIYVRNRHLQPILGRWIEADPFRALYLDGLNLYQYVRDNPIARTDKLGTCSEFHVCCPKCEVDMEPDGFGAGYSGEFQDAFDAINNLELFDDIIDLIDALASSERESEVLKDVLDKLGDKILGDREPKAAIERAVEDLWNMSRNFAGESLGWRLYTRITYNKCHCFLGIGLTYWPASEDKTPWVEDPNTDHGTMGLVQGTYDRQSDAKGTIKTACQKQIADWIARQGSKKLSQLPDFR